MHVCPYVLNACGHAKQLETFYITVGCFLGRLKIQVVFKHMCVSHKSWTEEDAASLPARIKVVFNHHVCVCCSSNSTKTQRHCLPEFKSFSTIMCVCCSSKTTQRRSATACQNLSRFQPSCVCVVQATVHKDAAPLPARIKVAAGSSRQLPPRGMVWVASLKKVGWHEKWLVDAEQYCKIARKPGECQPVNINARTQPKMPSWFGSA